MKITFISRHELTPAQEATLQAMGYTEWERREILFEHPVQQMRQMGLREGEDVAIVAPLWVGVELLNAGYEIVEFRNQPSARAKGVFLCLGATRMRFAGGAFSRRILSKFYFCPIPWQEQEAVPVAAVQA